MLAVKKKPIVLLVLAVIALASAVSYYRIYTGPFQQASAEYIRRHPGENVQVSSCVFCYTNINTGNGNTTYRFTLDVNRQGHRSRVLVTLKERDGEPVSISFAP